MGEQSENLLSEVLALAKPELANMLEQLKTLSYDYKVLRRRIMCMAIFADRTSPSGNVRKRSDVVHQSTAEEELLYEHRRNYESLMKAIDTANAAVQGLTTLSGSSRDSLALLEKVTGNLRAIEASAFKRVEAMGDILAELREQLSDKERKMMSLLHDRAVLVQQMMMHRDKMEVARETNAASGDIKSRLAAKYGLTMVDLENMLQAQPALLEEMDAVRIAP